MRAFSSKTFGNGWVELIANVTVDESCTLSNDERHDERGNPVWLRGEVPASDFAGLETVARVSVRGIGELELAGDNVLSKSCGEGNEE